MTSRNFAVFTRDMASSSSNKKKKMVNHSRWSDLPNHINEMNVVFQPMVLFKYNLGKGIFGFFSFEDKKVYWIYIKGRYPAIHCAGSCEIWLVLSSPSRCNYFLLNPFTVAKVDFPYLNRHGVDNFTKVILLDSPIDITTKKKKKSLQLSYLEMSHGIRSLTFSWLPCKFQESDLYFISTNGELWIINLLGPKLRATARTLRVLINLTVGLNIQKECYLVESEENLFMVVRIKRKSLRKTVKFFIYKEENLPDDQALFLGRFCSKLVSISEYGGLQGNSIYFSDDKLLQKTRLPEYPETGIYNVRSGSITPCLPFDLYPFDLPHIWITPSI
ncbi:hypothetical protein NE237_002180 [Protea cynaroides]|uniref:KIB1-4 beta-propeller domain-containing protein n=1 Tax=Protea cynaroides TaxID=273540 RepID=A0A9Q0KUY3_9MAGN|nr:hypothetical protein NE237_002180 [Protea cynaroides]